MSELTVAMFAEDLRKHGNNFGIVIGWVDGVCLFVAGFDRVKYKTKAVLMRYHCDVLVINPCEFRDMATKLLEAAEEYSPRFIWASTNGNRQAEYDIVRLRRSVNTAKPKSFRLTIL